MMEAIPFTTTNVIPINIFAQSDVGCRNVNCSGAGFRIAALDSGVTPYTTVKSGQYYNAKMYSSKIEAIALLLLTNELVISTQDIRDRRKRDENNQTDENTTDQTDDRNSTISFFLCNHCVHIFISNRFARSTNATNLIGLT